MSEIFDNTVPSPCIAYCCVDDQQICQGCFRSLAEIAAWSAADRQTRLTIVENAKRRADDAQAL
ncbi:DUF1289 domain-containing protein [Methylomonas paludis]|uniref:DUF1289 domain-containing protein n=1 Tax=Methylomonas paludis TaxID=1173101 RepID=A0A975R9X7_9GAMM|nr:DUF1289 domain-containing protein [Methylomonas paludis]QWF70743.1 DUF1289 domain-containing protein [Methylomonas paludis]